MNLREVIQNERAVFLNPKEFGEEMLIDGVSCLGLWDKDKDEPVKLFSGMGYEDTFGVFTVERVLFFMRVDGAAVETPVPEKELDIDGKIWTVRDASLTGGIVEALLYRNES